MTRRVFLEPDFSALAEALSRRGLGPGNEVIVLDWLTEDAGDYLVIATVKGRIGAGIFNPAGSDGGFGEWDDATLTDAESVRVAEFVRSVLGPSSKADSTAEGPEAHAGGTDRGDGDDTATDVLVIDWGIDLQHEPHRAFEIGDRFDGILACRLFEPVAGHHDSAGRPGVNIAAMLDRSGIMTKLIPPDCGIPYETYVNIAGQWTVAIERSDLTLADESARSVSWNLEFGMLACDYSPTQPGYSFEVVAIRPVTDAEISELAYMGGSGRVLQLRRRG